MFYLFVIIYLTATLANAQVNEDQRDISKLLGFVCEFCQNLALTADAIDCGASSDCTEINGLCGSFVTECCSTDERLDCRISTKIEIQTYLELLNDLRSKEMISRNNSNRIDYIIDEYKKRANRKRVMRKKSASHKKWNRPHIKDTSSIEDASNDESNSDDRSDNSASSAEDMALEYYEKRFKRPLLKKRLRI